MAELLQSSIAGFAGYLQQSVRSSYSDQLQIQHNRFSVGCHMNTALILLRIRPFCPYRTGDSRSLRLVFSPERLNVRQLDLTFSDTCDMIHQESSPRVFVTAAFLR